jgi:hypothetical protein
VVDKNCLETDRAPGSQVPMGSQARGSATTARGRRLRNDEIDGDDDLLAVGFPRCEPGARCCSVVQARRNQFESRAAHRRLELRFVTEKRRVQGQIPVSRVGSDGDVVETGT